MALTILSTSGRHPEVAARQRGPRRMTLRTGHHPSRLASLAPQDDGESPSPANTTGSPMLTRHMRRHREPAAPSPRVDVGVAACAVLAVRGRVARAPVDEGDVRDGAHGHAGG